MLRINGVEQPIYFNHLLYSMIVPTKAKFYFVLVYIKKEIQNDNRKNRKTFR
ncbi:hypothetical protein MHK_008637 [Candidatus Magnetomorum sp. HK-1]|nr:hypothetical protein MHK_008637 [Candidatus Magnetomorum sp. HK-1]